MLSLQKIGYSFVLFLTLLVCRPVEATVVKDANLQQTMYRGGVRLGFAKHRLDQKQIELLLQSLRAKTGWQKLEFDTNGFLFVDDASVVQGGSKSARDLLLAAISSSKQFRLESHAYSPKVSFSRLDVSQIHQKMTSDEKIEICPLQIDFSDFRQLKGDRDLLAAFDLGMIVLHELVHGVHELHDSLVPGEIGACERFINTIRQELLLPERDQYVAKSYLRVSNSGTTNQAALPFKRKRMKDGAPVSETAMLSWDIDRVGSIATMNPETHIISRNKIAVQVD